MIDYLGKPPEHSVVVQFWIRVDLNNFLKPQVKSPMVEMQQYALFNISMNPDALIYCLTIRLLGHSFRH